MEQRERATERRPVAWPATGPLALTTSNGNLSVEVGAVQSATDAAPLRLDSVACQTDTACLAVGASVVSNTFAGVTAPLALSNGSVAVGTVQAVAGTGSTIRQLGLTGVACPTNASCLAVGTTDVPMSFTAGVAVLVTLPPALTTMTAAQNATASSGASTVSLSASVSSSSAVNEGQVTFAVTDSNNNQVGNTVTANVTNGAASGIFAIPSGAAAGPYIITAAYTDSAGAFAASQGTATLTITPASAATTTTVSNASATFGTPGVTLSSAVTSGAGTVGEGQITFTVTNSSNQPVGAPVAATVTNGAASGSFAIPSGTPVGSYTVTAAYTDSSGSFQGSSGTGTLIIAAAPTTTSISSSADPSVFGQPVTFVAAVAAVAPGAGTPSETVTFYDGSNTLGTGTLSGNAPDQASLSIASLQVGQHQITATYGGAPDFLSSSTATALAEAVSCPKTVTGTSTGALNVTASMGCAILSNATVRGDVTVQPGAAISISNSGVTGRFTVDGATAVTICGSSVTTRLTVSGSTGFVLLGSDGDDAAAPCAGNTIKGPVQLDGNHGGMELGGNTDTGDVTVQNNSGAGPVAEDAAPEIENNRISGSLSCSGNTPAPINDGRPNAVTGAKLGQCAAPGF